ncbi:MAG TPA: 8-amino-7-oxononanoate synthase [Burkholderiales bacterium]|nr:8-amino-7-oxononanoate synthase [Burkholderiales bacterium]
MLEEILAQLAALERDGLRRSRLVLEGAQGPRVRVDGRELLAFCSNDYLGLANHPALIQAAQEGAERYGVGSGASHLITGHQAAHHRLEEELAVVAGLPRALLFSTGYMANLGVASALLGRGDALFADRLNHASLNDAAVLSRARLMRFPHGDLEALGRQLAASKAMRKLVATDAVFSMDGDIADLPRLLDLAERYDAWLLVDDAHGFGVLGEGGRGTLAHFGLRSSRIVYMATLGKAAGVFGAFAAGEPELVEYLAQRARSYIYTTATPPLLAHALSRSLALIREEGWRREHLRELVARLRAGVAGLPWKLLPSETPIQPLMIGASRDAVELSRRLRERGILVPAIRPPTVPQGTARLRVSLSAAHAPEDVDRLVAALSEVQ